MDVFLVADTLVEVAIGLVILAALRTGKWSRVAIGLVSYCFVVSPLLSLAAALCDI